MNTESTHIDGLNPRIPDGQLFSFNRKVNQEPAVFWKAVYGLELQS